MLMIDYREMSWWYWLVTALLLSAGFFVTPDAFLGAIGVTVWQLIHYRLREGSNNAFPVQVRFWYLMLLLVALHGPMQWLYWVPTIGTWAQLIFGYCTMARLVSLFPWNRSEPFTWSLVRRTFFSAPVRGNILQGLPPVGQS
ncbi:MAG: hypothetical protein ABW095_17050 [Candidatus Thiodiazotropha sp.]